MIRPLVRLVLLAAVSGCFHHSSGARAGPDGNALPGRSGRLAPSGIGVLTVLEIVLPEAGRSIGGYFTGLSFERRVGDVRMGDGVRRWLMRVTRERADSLLRRAGYVVRGPAPASSDAQPITDVRFALSARVEELSVKVAGNAHPPRIEAATDVSWELLDVASGLTIFGVHTRGAVVQADSIEGAVLAALDSAVNGLLADQNFHTALSTPRSRQDEALFGFSWSRKAPGPRDTVHIGAEDRNVARDSAVVDRTLAALVTIRVERGAESAGFVITRDGLAITTTAIAHPTKPIWARFTSGIERPVRVLRQHGDVALIQVSCPDPCQTLDVDVAGWPATGVSLVGVGLRTGYVVEPGDIDGSCGFLSHSARYIHFGAIGLSGDVLLRPSDGRVVAMAITRTNASCAYSVRDIFRWLRIVPDPVSPSPTGAPE